MRVSIKMIYKELSRSIHSLARSLDRHKLFCVTSAHQHTTPFNPYPYSLIDLSHCTDIKCTMHFYCLLSMILCHFLFTCQSNRLTLLCISHIAAYRIINGFDTRAFKLLEKYYCNEQKVAVCHSPSNMPLIPRKSIAQQLNSAHVNRLVAIDG